MAVIEFLGYNVLEASYKRNSNFDLEQSEPFINNPELDASIKVENDNAEVILSIKLGSLEEIEVPFRVEVLVKGHFKFNSKEDEFNLGFEHFLKVNAVAILYPYIRALISNYINMSNEFPGYNLPTINVSQALSKVNENE